MAGCEGVVPGPARAGAWEGVAVAAHWRGTGLRRFIGIFRLQNRPADVIIRG